MKKENQQPSFDECPDYPNERQLVPLSSEWLYTEPQEVDASILGKWVELNDNAELENIGLDLASGKDESCQVVVIGKSYPNAAQLAEKLRSRGIEVIEQQGEAMEGLAESAKQATFEIKRAKRIFSSGFSKISPNKRQKALAQRRGARHY